MSMWSQTLKLTPVFSSLSDPAKSTRFSLAVTYLTSDRDRERDCEKEKTCVFFYSVNHCMFSTVKKKGDVTVTRQGNNTSMCTVKIRWDLEEFLFKACDPIMWFNSAWVKKEDRYHGYILNSFIHKIMALNKLICTSHISFIYTTHTFHFHLHYTHTLHFAHSVYI